MFTVSVKLPAQFAPFRFQNWGLAWLVVPGPMAGFDGRMYSSFGALSSFDRRLLVASDV